MSSRGVLVLVVAGAMSASLWSTPTVPAAGREPASTGRLFVVQAVPGIDYTVSLDEVEEAEDIEVGTVLGPFELAPGRHAVRFEPDSGPAMTASVRVDAGRSVDLVLHLPADVGGDPVADVYRTSAAPVPAGRARVLVAHTATVPPADVRVDGQVVFEDIANGEFATADVPAGPHTAALLPAGGSGDPILGPLDVDLPAGTVTMVYAVGTPSNGSMNVITHQEATASRIARPLREIDTGAAGLVRRVATFGG